MFTKKLVEFRLNGDVPVKLEVPATTVFVGVRVKDNFPHVIALVPAIAGLTKFVEIVTVLANREFGEIGQEFKYIGNFQMMRRASKDAPPEDFGLHILYREVSNEEVMHNAPSGQPSGSVILP